MIQGGALMVNEDISNRTILVAVDGSIHSMMAARTAIQFAKAQKLSIYGIYVIDARLVLRENSSYALELDNINLSFSKQKLIKEFKIHGENVLNWIELYCKESEVNVTTELLFGGLPEIVLESASHHVMLAMGRCGYSNALHPDHLGTNFKEIACHAKVPLLLGGEEYHPIRRSLIVLDRSKLADSVLTWAKQLHKSLSSHIVVHLLEDKDNHHYWVSKVLSKLHKSGIREYELLGGYASSGAEIAQAAINKNVDLIVMPTYKKKIFDIGFARNPFEDVLLQSNLPILAICER
jgi:nucleotide-binding universal stress UspA family protein